MSGIRQESVSALYSVTNAVDTNHTRSTFIKHEDPQIFRIFDSVCLSVFKERYIPAARNTNGYQSYVLKPLSPPIEVRPPPPLPFSPSQHPILLETAWKLHKLSQSVDRVALSRFQARDRSSHSADCA